jgi:hypothetical protein
MAETNLMVTSTPHPSKATLSWKEKTLIFGLLCLEIPFGLVLFPLAAVCVLTGILAPLGILSFRVATMPFSWAMNLRTAWQLRDETNQ